MTIPPELAPEIMVLFAVNFFETGMGLLVTVISYLGYRSSDRNPSLRNAVIGFGLITAGTAVEPAYQLGIVGTHILASEQNVLLQIGEALLISSGFAVLFFSIYRYSSRSRRHRVTVTELDDEFSD